MPLVHGQFVRTQWRKRFLCININGNNHLITSSLKIVILYFTNNKTLTFFI